MLYQSDMSNRGAPEPLKSTKNKAESACSPCGYTSSLWTASLVQASPCGFTFCHCFGIFVHRTEEGGCSRTEAVDMRQNTQRRQASHSLCRPVQTQAAGTLGS